MSENKNEKKDGKEKVKSKGPNCTGKSRRLITYSAMMGGNATVSLADQLRTAERFMAHPERWPAK